MCNTKNHFIATSESHLEIVHWSASAGLSAGLLLSPPKQGAHQQSRILDSVAHGLIRNPMASPPE